MDDADEADAQALPGLAAMGSQVVTVGLAMLMANWEALARAVLGGVRAEVDGDRAARSEVGGRDVGPTGLHVDIPRAHRVRVAPQRSAGLTMFEYCSMMANADVISSRSLSGVPTFTTIATSSTHLLASTSTGTLSVTRLLDQEPRQSSSTASNAPAHRHAGADRAGQISGSPDRSPSGRGSRRTRRSRAPWAGARRGRPNGSCRTAPVM